MIINDIPSIKPESNEDFLSTISLETFYHDIESNSNALFLKDTNATSIIQITVY